VTLDSTFDPEGLTIEQLVKLARREADLLAATLPDALAAQWEAHPHPRSREDSQERKTTGVSDPTFHTASDDERLRLRRQVVRSTAILRRTAIELRGVRRGLELTLGEWETD
jgi:hypothetical protein